MPVTTHRPRGQQDRGAGSDLLRDGGEHYDPCCHLACDTYDNNSDEALDQMSDAAAHAVLTFAMTTSAVPGTGRGRGNAFGLLEFDGSLAQL